MGKFLYCIRFSLSDIALTLATDNLLFLYELMCTQCSRPNQCEYWYCNAKTSVQIQNLNFSISEHENSKFSQEQTASRPNVLPQHFKSPCKNFQVWCTNTVWHTLKFLCTLAQSESVTNSLKTFKNFCAGWLWLLAPLMAFTLLHLHSSHFELCIWVNAWHSHPGLCTTESSATWPLFYCHALHLRAQWKMQACVTFLTRKTSKHDPLSVSVASMPRLKWVVQWHIKWWVLDTLLHKGQIQTQCFSPIFNAFCWVQLGGSFQFSQQKLSSNWIQCKTWIQWDTFIWFACQSNSQWFHLWDLRYTLSNILWQIDTSKKVSQVDQWMQLQLSDWKVLPRFDWVHTFCLASHAMKC